MKNIKYLIAPILFTMLITSCDDKIGSLEDLNKAPFAELYRISTGVWQTTQDYQTITDSVKFYNDANNLPYSVSMRLRDINNNFGFISLESAQSYNQFYVNDDIFEQNFLVELDSFSLSLKNGFDFNKNFSVKVEDTWGKNHNVNFALTYFSNQAPVADLRTNVINVNEYELDGSNSFDKDQKWGGFIRTYEFVINNSFVITTNQAKVKHVFSFGVHNIKLRVKDNDDVWSQTVSVNISVN